MIRTRVASEDGRAFGFRGAVEDGQELELEQTWPSARKAALRFYIVVSNLQVFVCQCNDRNSFADAH